MRSMVSFAACGLLAMLCGTADARPLPHIPHIRSTHHELLRLLADGCRRSRTLDTLVKRIEQSDLLVYLEWGSDVPLSLRAYLRLAGAGPVHRYLRIKVKIPARDETVLLLLAHELQHAAEVADAPDVRTEADLDTLYRRIGDDSGAGWDSKAARDIGPIVRAELRNANRAEQRQARSHVPSAEPLPQPPDTAANPLALRILAVRWR